MSPDIKSSSRWPSALLLLLVLLTGFYVRFDALFVWQENKDRFYFDNQSTPLMLTADAYYYLDIAKQIQRGGFEPHDMRRQAPVGMDLNPTPPMMSVLLAWLADLTGAKLESLAIILPTIWGGLIAIPAFLVGERMYSNTRPPGRMPSPQKWLTASESAGLVTALMTVMAPKLVQRSAVGWFDTDGLNVLFAMSGAYFALRLIDADARRQQLIWITAGALNLMLYIWSWDQAPIAPLLLGGGPLGIAILANAIRQPSQRIPLAISVLVLLAALVAWKGFRIIDPREHLGTASRMLDYFLNTVTAESPFPDSGRYVSEQAGSDLPTMARDVTGNLYLLLAAMLGIAALIWLNPYHVLALAPLLVVAALAFNARRFVIFLSPIVALGLAAYAWWIWRQGLPAALKSILLLGLVVLSVWQPYERLLKENKMAPRRTPDIFDAMLAIDKLADPDALIWGSWGHGHGLIHYTDRATVADGMYHPAELSYVINYPFTITDYRLAANWIRFYSVHGLSGLREINARLGADSNDWKTAMPEFQDLLAAGPTEARRKLGDLTVDEREQLLEFIFPREARQVVLFLEHIHAYTAWYQAGAWDFATRSAPGTGPFMPLENTRPINKSTISAKTSNGPVTISLTEGILTTPAFKAELERIDVGMKGGTRAAKFDHDSDYVARVNLQSKTGIVGTRAQVVSMYSSLFYALTADQTYFKPLKLNPPLWGLWVAEGEAYVPPKKK